MKPKNVSSNQLFVYLEFIDPQIVTTRLQIVFSSTSTITLNPINKNQHYVICGDMNINVLELNSITNQLKDVLNSWSKIVSQH